MATRATAKTTIDPAASCSRAVLSRDPSGVSSRSVSQDRLVVKGQRSPNDAAVGSTPTPPNSTLPNDLAIAVARVLYRIAERLQFEERKEGPVQPKSTRSTISIS